MHIHTLVIDSKTGKNIFSDKKGGETEAFMHFIAGMQNHLTGAIAVLAPYVNSYRRDVPDFAAPINLEWGRDNRTTGLRIPISSPAGRRAGKPAARHGCEPLSWHRGHAGLWLSWSDEKKDPRPEFTSNALYRQRRYPHQYGRRFGPVGGGQGALRRAGQ